MFSQLDMTKAIFDFNNSASKNQRKKHFFLIQNQKFHFKVVKCARKIRLNKAKIQHDRKIN